MRNLLCLFLDLIYRKKCYICGNSKQSLKICNDCYNKLDFSDRRVNRIINGCNIYCAGIYTKELQKVIRGLKYHKQKELAYYQAKFMFDYFLQIDEMRGKEFELVAVPSHKNRLKQRKYDHIELVCENFSKLSGYTCNFNLIKRIKDTKPQYKLNRQQRMINLANAFSVDTGYYNGKPILLIDDICTTGSTFEEIINTFNRSGITDITGFTTATPL